jgi:hypothetical protein
MNLAFHQNTFVWGGFGTDTNGDFEICILDFMKCLAGHFSLYKVENVYFACKS